MPNAKSGINDPGQGRLVDNIIYFCRALRRAGVPVAPSQIKDLIRAVEIVGFSHKKDFFETLRACLITKHEHLLVFEQVFHLFWRDPEFLNKMMQTLLPFAQNIDENPPAPKPGANRAAEAITDHAGDVLSRDIPDQEELILDAQLSFSQNERLASMDFEQMSNTEVKDAERAIAQLDFNLPKLPSRRYRHSPFGNKVDVRSTLQSARFNGGEVLRLLRKRRIDKPRNLTILIDISGSMSTYSRMMMHFANAITTHAHRNNNTNWTKINTFTFGTQLTNISRQIAGKDPDFALNSVGQLVKDWDGGTQIAANLEKFNLLWSRRVLSSGSVVLLMTDGLERGDTLVLEHQIKRLKLSCDKLIWLNPLLRFNEFQPLANGIKTILPHVDKMVACHSITSLVELSKAFERRESNWLA